MTSNAHFPTDYDQYAPTYAWARWAVAWVLAPLARRVQLVAQGSTIVEAGCGTGNYICALAALRPDLTYAGFDVSEPMLAQARARSTPVSFVHANASEAFPFADGQCALVFAVDVVHHIEDLDRFFTEARRVVASHGHVVIVTDSEATMRGRSLTKFFPEILAVELARYPDPQRLHTAASAAGLHLVQEEQAIGDIPLADDFVARLEAKCSSAMRLLPPEVHAAGMARVKAAQAKGGVWRSHYVVFHYAPAGAASV